MRQWLFLWICLLTSAAPSIGCGADETTTGAGGSGGGVDLECVITGEHALPRGEMMGVYDPKRGERIVFFGGDVGVAQNCNASPEPYGELWVYDTRCKTFEQVPDAGGGPSPRARGVSIYDPEGDRMIMFGGRYRDAPMMPYQVFNDVWALDLETLTWTEVATTGTSPSARSSTAAVYDPVGKQMIVFGGNESTSGLSFTPRNDAFALDLATGAWRQIMPAGTPPEARLFHSATVDPATGRVYVYGGGDANAFTGPFLADLWSLDPATGAWTEESAGGASAPDARIHAGLFFDEAAGRLVLFAGHDDQAVGNQNDTWAFDVANKTWMNLVPPEAVQNPPPDFCVFPPDFTTPNLTAPDRRSAYLGVHGQGLTSVWVYGGKTDCGNIDDVWVYDLPSNTWTREVESTIGEACARGDNPEQCSTLCI